MKNSVRFFFQVVLQVDHEVAMVAPVDILSLFLSCSIMFSKALPVAAARFWQINNIPVNAAAAH